MAQLPLLLRLLIVAVVFMATAWAFASGQMLIAVIGVVLCFLVFRQMFMTI